MDQAEAVLVVLLVVVQADTSVVVPQAAAVVDPVEEVLAAHQVAAPVDIAVAVPQAVAVVDLQVVAVAQEISVL